MPIDEVQRYDDLYLGSRSIVDEQAVSDSCTRQPEIAAALMFIDKPGGVSTEEARTLMTNCEVTLLSAADAEGAGEGELHDDGAESR